MSLMWTKRTRAQCAGWGRALLACVALLGLVLRAHGQIEIQTIGGGPRLNSCAAFAGFASGDTYTNAQFNDPYACALDSKSNLWVADTGNSDMEQITFAGDRANSQTIHTYTYVAITNKSGHHHQLSILTIIHSRRSTVSQSILPTTFMSSCRPTDFW